MDMGRGQTGKRCRWNRGVPPNHHENIIDEQKKQCNKQVDENNIFLTNYFIFLFVCYISLCFAIFMHIYEQKACLSTLTPLGSQHIYLSRITLQQLVIFFQQSGLVLQSRNSGTFHKQSSHALFCSALLCSALLCSALQPNTIEHRLKFPFRAALANHVLYQYNFLYVLWTDKLIYVIQYSSVSSAKPRSNNNNNNNKDELSVLSLDTTLLQLQSDTKPDQHVQRL